MAKEVAALNTFWLVQYLEERHGDIDLERLIVAVGRQFPCYVENLSSGEIEPVRLDHLRNPRYWFSHRFVKALHDLIQQEIPDPRLGYKIGSAMYKTQPLIRTTLGLSLLGVHRVAAKVSSEAAKYNRTKRYLVRKLAKGYVEIRIIHEPGIVISEFTMQWNAGCFFTYARLAGATDIDVELRCVDPGPETHLEQSRAVWDFFIHYQEPPLLTRLAKASLACLPWIRRLTEEAEAMEAELQEQIFCRDRIIADRTDKLLAIQQRLIEEERKTIEQKLRDISRELVSTEERERKALAADLHDSVTQLLAVSLFKIKAARKKHDQISELQELQGHIEEALAELRSLTFQISPPVLYDFGLEAALEWLVEDINSGHGMELLFSNLLDSPLRINQEQRVNLYRAVRELIINIVKHARTRHGQVLLQREGDTLLIEVEDEGVGFVPSSITHGFGLSTMKDRLLCLNAEVTVDATPGEGTTIRLTIPEDLLGAGIAAPEPPVEEVA